MSRSGVILPPEDDPDPTDRLPELETASHDGSGNPLESTGSWSLGSGLADAMAGERIQELEDQLAGRDAALADLTSRLTQKTFALTRLEKELQQARSELQSASGSARAAGSLEERLRQEEQARQAIEAERDEHREAIGRLENQLSEARENEHRLEQKVEELTDQLLELQEAHSIVQDRLAGGEARLAELENELAEALRESMSAVQQREFDQLREHTASLKRALAVAKEELAGLEQERNGLSEAVQRSQAGSEEMARALRERDQRLELLLEKLRNAEARRRFDADMRRAEVSPPAPDPRLVAVSRQLEEERSERERLEHALAILQAERLQPRSLRRQLMRLDEGHEAALPLLPPRTTIGRTPDNDLQLRENYISRSHAVIKLGGDSAIIEDAGSRNGVFVNDRRVRRELLHDGDIVMLGKARFRFEVLAADAD